MVQLGGHPVVSNGDQRTTKRTAAARFSSPDAERLIGQVVVGRYRVRAMIAHGSTGDIYESVQLPIGRQVALKILRVEDDDPAAPRYRKRFQLEASSAARIAHPNVVTVYDYGQTETGDLFIAMEYLAGRSLGQMLDEVGRFDTRRSLNVAIQIVRALRKAHGFGVVHRDLKPANIMLTPDEDDLDFVKVLDFGIVKIFSPDAEEIPGVFNEPDLTNADVLLGTPGYMSPEQAVGEEIDARADVYGIGVLLHEMITGEPPFTGRTLGELIRKQVVQDPPFISEVAPDLEVSRELEMLVHRCLQRKREDRPASAQALLGELKAIWRMETDESFGTEATLTPLRAEAPAVSEVPSQNPIEDPSLVGTVPSTVQLDALHEPSRKWLWIVAVLVFVIGGLAGGLWLGASPDPIPVEPIAPIEQPIVPSEPVAPIEPARAKPEAPLPEGDADDVVEDDTYKDNPY